MTFHKNGCMQALIQFESAAAAAVARNSLDSTSMFGNSHNLLRIQFSKLQNLNVKYNNDKSRDYTVVAAAAAASSSSSSSSPAAAALAYQQQAHVDATTDPHLALAGQSLSTNHCGAEP